MPTATQHKLFPTGVSLPEKSRLELIDLLNARLADAIDLKTQTKRAHWNVKGPRYIQVHELFDEIATHADDAADLLAERATALGGVALGTARLVASTSTLNEYDLNAVTGEQHLKALSKALAAVANASRAGIDQSGQLGDQATADVFTESVRQADKDVRFLEAHLQD
jgi:starvation-inducible DNA-binding protein